MGILDSYMKQVNEDNSLDEMSIDFDGITSNDKEKEEIIREIKKIKNDPNDIVNKFHMDYPNVSEDELDINGFTGTTNVNVVVKHVYCPNCRKELISKQPLMFNPYTGEKIAKHECPCGYKANLEYSYPRVMFVDDNGNEIKAFGI